MIGAAPMLSMLLQMALADGGDPCAPGGDASAPEPPDPTSAAAYRSVGDEARGRGDAAAARVAYRQALRSDPGDASSRAALEALCRPAHFDEGTRLMERGDRRGAIVAFEAARALGPDPAAALLEGICEHELGNDRRAGQLLREARAEPAVADAASFFLGLIALGEGDAGGASALLATAATGTGPIAESAADLLHVSRRDGRVVASVLTEAGFDSNVALLPDGSPTRTGGPDGYGAGLAGLFLRPFGVTGPYARLTAQYRKHLEVTAFDLGDLGGAIGVRAGGGGRTLAAEYGYDFLSLGGAAYLSAHRLLGTGRWAVGRLALAATYALRLESFLTSATAGYSGLRHDGEAEAGWRIGKLAGASIDVGLGYHVGRDGARDAPLAYLEHGPVALLRLGMAGPWRLIAEGRFTLRGYDAVDPDLGVDRADRYLDGGAAAEIDVSDHFTVRAAATARRAFSNVPDFQYTKLTASVGLLYAGGL